MITVAVVALLFRFLLASSEGPFNQAHYEKCLALANQERMQQAILMDPGRYQRYHAALVEFEPREHGSEEFKKAIYDSRLKTLY